MKCQLSANMGCAMHTFALSINSRCQMQPGRRCGTTSELASGFRSKLPLEIIAILPGNFRWITNKVYMYSPQPAPSSERVSTKYRKTPVLLLILCSILGQNGPGPVVCVFSFSCLVGPPSGPFVAWWSVLQCRSILNHPMP